MSEKKRIVIPGEEIAKTEEYLPGKGTFEMKGGIYSSFLGYLNLDFEEKVASVDPINPLVKLDSGDVVLARVEDVRSSMIITNIMGLEGGKRGVSGETQASIHVSKISEGYTSDVWKEYRIGDIIRAMVVQVKPSLQLSTDRPNLGALISLCTKCRKPLVKMEKGLFCENCQRTELRRTAPDYGRYGFNE